MKIGDSEFLIQYCKDNNLICISPLEGSTAYLRIKTNSIIGRSLSFGKFDSSGKVIESFRILSNLMTGYETREFIFSDEYYESESREFYYVKIGNVFDTISFTSKKYNFEICLQELKHVFLKKIEEANNLSKVQDIKLNDIFSNSVLKEKFNEPKQYIAKYLLERNAITGATAQITIEIPNLQLSGLVFFDD